MLDEIGRTQRDSIEHRKAVTAQEAHLRREQDQLLQAHYAGAIPLDLLRREQDRITRGLASVSRELEQLSADAAITKAHLEAALDLLEDCASTYRDAPAHIKKLMNQAFFQKVLINPESGIEPPATAVNAVEQLNPYLSHILSAQARHAATKGQTCEEPSEAGRLSDQGDSDEPIPANIAHVTGFRPVTLVELKGCEICNHPIGPACSCLAIVCLTRASLVLGSVEDPSVVDTDGHFSAVMLCICCARRGEHDADKARAGSDTGSREGCFAARFRQDPARTIWPLLRCVRGSRPPAPPRTHDVRSQTGRRRLAPRRASPDRAG